MAMTLEPDQVAAAVSAERLALADLMAQLSEEELATRSLCAAWTVRDVLAHLTTTTRLRIPMLARAILRARGSFDRMEVDLAADRAARFSTAELIDQLRESAQSSRRFPGSSAMDPLMDLVVHAQDVARPLGRVHETPAPVRAAVLSYLTTNRLMGGPKRIAGLRLESTDSPWAAGTGPLVRGSDAELLLALAGRPAASDRLSGPGVTTLRARLDAR